MWEAFKYLFPSEIKAPATIPCVGWQSAPSELGREVEALGNDWLTSAFEDGAKTCRGILDRSIKSYTET